MLRELAGSEEWWNSVFNDGGFVAGGAASFVADPCQCIGALGDIDIWAPVHVSTIWRWVDALVTLYALRGIEYKVYADAPSNFTVATAYMSVQFIRLHMNARSLDIIRRFDFTYVQAALYKVAADDDAPFSGLVLLHTVEAHTAFETRRLVAIPNSLVWNGAGAVDNRRMMVRMEKAARKGFTLASATDRQLMHPWPEPHVCDLGHRRANKLPEVRCVDDLRQLCDGLKEFDENNYVEAARERLESERVRMESSRKRVK